MCCGPTMAFWVFLRPPLSPWRRVKQAHSSQHQLGRMLQLRTGRCVASKPTENEWTLDLDTDMEEVNHAPQDEEPHPPHPTTQHRSMTSRSGRLLFNVGKKIMTADEFVRKTAVASRKSQITMDTTDYDDSVAKEEEEGEGVGWVEWGMGEEGEGEGEERRDTGKKKGLHSMRQTRKFLRGKALAGSRLTTPPSPETADLLEGLERHLSLSAGHREVFSAVPSVLGSCGSEMEERVRELRRVGFTRREVETVLVSFPPILQVDFRNVYEVCCVLKKCIPGGYMLRGLMARHPFLFLQPVKQIEERVTVLKDVCRDPNALGFLLHHFPLLLFVPLTPSTLHTITKFTPSHSPGRRAKGEEGEGAAKKGVLGHSWVAKSLYHNLSTRPARMDPGPDINALVDLLAEYQLDPAPTFIKFPTFFKTTYPHVVSLLTVLTGSPLYLHSGAVRTLLVSIPDQLVWTRDAEQLQTHLTQLCSLFSSPKDCCEKVQSYPGLVLPQLDLASWLDSLVSHGFTTQQTASLVSDTPNILLQDREKEFMPRLRLLVSIPGAAPSCLVSCSAGSRVRMLSTPVNVLTERLNYVKRCKPELVLGQHMEVIFGSKEREFATFCGKTVAQVHSDTRLNGIELKRFSKSAQSSPRNRVKLVSEHHEEEHLHVKNRSSFTSDVASSDTAASDNEAKSVKTNASRTSKNGASSVTETGTGKTRKTDTDDATTSSQRKKKKSSNNETAPKRNSKRVTRNERVIMGSSRERAALDNVTTNVMTGVFTTTAGRDLLGQHQTADTLQTSTADTSRGKGNYARKRETHT